MWSMGEHGVRNNRDSGNKTGSKALNSLTDPKG